LEGNKKARAVNPGPTSSLTEDFLSATNGETYKPETEGWLLGGDPFHLTTRRLIHART
jgi:hypothetical protein